MPPTVDLRLGDCLEVMGDIPDASIDLVLSDPPYGTTACRWDTVIPFEPLWAHYRRILKPRGAVVLTASQPFTSMLVMSNREWFKYCWYWEKSKGANFAMTGFQPLKVVEEVVIFAPLACTYTSSHNNMTYNAQYDLKAKPRKADFRKRRDHETAPLRNNKIAEKTYTHSTPRNLLYASTDGDGRVHPTQKPVSLLEYLIKTYSHESDVVLDNCSGSCSTGIACLNTGRRFIGIEKDPKIFAVGKRRIEDRQRDIDSMLIKPWQSHPEPIRVVS